MADEYETEAQETLRSDILDRSRSPHKWHLIESFKTPWKIDPRGEKGSTHFNIQRPSEDRTIMKLPEMTTEVKKQKTYFT